MGLQSDRRSRPLAPSQRAGSAACVCGFADVPRADIVLSTAIWSSRLHSVTMARTMASAIGDRQDAFTSALFVFPLFLVYQVGIVAGARGRNGADFITSALIRLCRSDLGVYLLLLAVASALYVGLLFWLRGRRTAHSRMFVQMLFEATVYASLMGALIQLLIVRFDRLVPILALADAGPFDIVVISAGAGLHEELMFRAGLLVLLIRVFALPTIRLGRIGGTLLALLLSSWAFAAAHHLGGGEPFTGVAFVYRSFAGAIFGLIYLYRGFGVAAWTHALYDVLVLSFD